MDIFKKIKDLLEAKSKKKLIENTVLVVIIGIIAIFAGSSFLSGNDKKDIEDGTVQSIQSTESIETAANVSSNTGETEIKLKYILTQIEGAGRVDVMITYSAGKENVPAYDTKISENSTDEKDSGGGTRKITQKSKDTSMVFSDGRNGDKNPVIIKELEPSVRGVLVVAEGASDPQVREKLGRAVQVLLDIPVHRIQIIERKK